MVWDPKQYLKFAGPRLLPALDLLSRIDTDDANLIVDLGCGAGNVSRLLRERWPDARIIGIDSSVEMLERAATEEPSIDWTHADLNQWRPESPIDLVFSNAALHWSDQHDELFPRLLSMLRVGGTLAVQMPRNFSAPSHQAVVATVESGPWRERLLPRLRREPVHSPDHYYGLLAAHTDNLSLWEIEYLHILEGENPVLDWTKGTVLVPLLSQLSSQEALAFTESYGERLRRAYPQQADGKTLFPFRRLFIVARRRR